MKKMRQLFFIICIWQVYINLLKLIRPSTNRMVFRQRASLSPFSNFIISIFYLMQLQHQMLPWLPFFLVGHAKVAPEMFACLQVKLVVVLQNY